MVLLDIAYSFAYYNISTQPPSYFSLKSGRLYRKGYFARFTESIKLGYAYLLAVNWRSFHHKQNLIVQL